jgi:RNA polymerase sigma-70 factor (ECF subfamily)
MEQAGSRSLSDAELLTRLADGCEGSWSEFYRRYQGRVYRFALQMTGSRAVAEDAVQETFLALMTSAGRYRPERGEVASFVFGIARNKIRHGLDLESRYAAMDDADEADSERLDSGLARQQEVERVRLAVLALPENYREAVVLCDLQELDYQQAAEAVGCAIGTIRSRLHRGRQLLSEKLRPVGQALGLRRPLRPPSSQGSQENKCRS